MTVPGPGAVPPEGARGNGATRLSAEPLRLSAEPAGENGFPALSALPARGGGPLARLTFRKCQRPMASWMV